MKKRKKKIKFKVGDCFFFHYVTMRGLEYYTDEFKLKVTEEDRTKEVFGYLDFNGDLYQWSDFDKKFQRLHGYGEGWPNDINYLIEELNNPARKNNKHYYPSEVIHDTELYWISK